jgi:hypothetical protein
MADLTGGCLCGRVRYTLSGEPAFTALCHCRNCQRYTGSSFEAVVVYPSTSLSLHGELKTYMTLATRDSRCADGFARTADQVSSRKPISCRA